jgi:hypothetical protein
MSSPTLYDVFVSCKVTEQGRAASRDLDLATEIYHYLSARSISIFLGTIELQRRGVSAFKSAIDEALDSSRVLVVVGTSRDNIESDWVRYEWDSFINDILSGVKTGCGVFTYIDGFSPSELPRSLRSHQVISHDDGLETLYKFVANCLATQPPRRRRPRGGARRSASPSVDIEQKFDRFHSDFVTANQIDALRGFAVRHMGGSIAPAEVLRGWLTANPRIFYRLNEVIDTGLTTTSRLVGYYSLRPVTRTAVALLDSCQLDGATLLPEHILPPDATPGAIYIGGVAASESIARAAVLFYLKIEVNRFRGMGVRTFYTKPITPDGARLALKHGFTPIVAPNGDTKHVYRLVFPD